MIQSIRPATIASASIVIQICLLIIAYGALGLLSMSKSFGVQARSSYSTLVVWLLMALVLLVMGEDLYATWGSILGQVTLPTVPRNYTFLAVFVLDIVFLTILVLRTGGTRNSPFTSVLFLLPALAIFLREPAWRFLSYAVVVGMIYAMLLRTRIQQYDERLYRASFEDSEKRDLLYADRAAVWTNLTCLALATLIGYITRPIG